MEYEDFLRVHEVLLMNTGLPRELYECLFEKLAADTFDAGESLLIEASEDGRHRRLVLKECMQKHETVFLVDHAWSFRLRDARKQLKEIPGLASRMADLMGVMDIKEYKSFILTEETDEEDSKSVDDVVAAALAEAGKTKDTIESLDLTSSKLTDGQLEELQLATSFPNLWGLDLRGNKLQSVEAVVQSVKGVSGLKSIHLGHNPVHETRGDELKAAVLEALPALEVYNSQLTPSYSCWAIASCCQILGECLEQAGQFRWEQYKDYVVEVDLSKMGMTRLTPEVFHPEKLPMLSTLDLRGNPLGDQTAAEMLHILNQLPHLGTLKVDVPGPLGSTMAGIAEELPDLQYLNGVPTAKLLQDDGATQDRQLAPRLTEWAPGEPLEDRVLRAMWRYVQVYRLATEEQYDETPVWYIMDEVGSAIRHSDEPSMAMAPFLYMPDGTLASAISYSIFWPIRDLEGDDEATRDFLPGINESQQRSARLTAWFHTPREYFRQAYKEHWKRKAQVEVCSVAPSSGGLAKPLVPRNGKLAVFTDLPPVQELLTHPSFTFVEDPREADIVFTSAQIDDAFRKAVGLREEQTVNQFPFEASLVMKHHLADTMQQAYGKPSWLQPTYNMETELAPLIGDFLQREEAGEDTLWIVKPWNMARSLDASVAGHLPQLIRLQETGPKVCQKYIERPALFRGRKFDLRFLVLVRSFRPLDAHLHHAFWSRIANKPYSTDPTGLEDFETHFTVMNYVGSGKVQHVVSHEFVDAFEKEHNVKWEDIEARVRAMLREVFLGAAAVHPEMQDDAARAIYGVDVMLDDAMQPKLLEVTYSPDCTRACKYDIQVTSGPQKGKWFKGADFYNSVFGCLFLNDTNGVSPL